MKHAVIVAHPRRRSYTLAVAAAYAEAARSLGHAVELRDLYRIGFDPRLQAAELPDEEGMTPGDDVLEERRRLSDADVFALIYPLWFNAPPAILKGYVDRVFSAGFGYELTPQGAVPLLEGRKLISFTSSGAPETWLQTTGALPALRTLFDNHVATMCGLTVVDHVHVGGLVAGLTEEAMDQILEDVRTGVTRRFAAPEIVEP
ncbi:NAD(P)H-dependent oxidoreductase [Phenylobacterium sp. J367]|uniref:NAD(P)H-dependent oxidoreductase n=1 Tax=Phenylobacterium sp. J367 TaxID=2898435 RepID=UPI002151DC4A|nr:NAD(P)H-dependent oxidoreductase [Phenylobacterium sp. J367]MCR5879298.1 NAD(P)H-dependent oxidoreductase [Phenylobacterium sp. J367]